MPIYRYTTDNIEPVSSATFQALEISERNDLQRLLRDRIEIIAPDTLVISEEFGSWDDSRRRIDLLAIDKEANLVVIELKRTDSGGHMELQAIRYAAMVSTMTFQQAVDAFRKYLSDRDDPTDAEQTILEFLEWDEPQENEFGTDVRIILASADFSRELTTAILWLCDRDIDVRCVRLRPYGTKEETFLDVQQVIPLPEAADYSVRVQEKRHKSRVSREKRDYTKYDLVIGDEKLERQAKRRVIHAILKHLLERGVSVDAIRTAFHWRTTRMIQQVEGTLNSDEFIAEAIRQNEKFDATRWLTKDDELVHVDGQTLAINNQWAGTKFEPVLQSLIDGSSASDVSFEQAS